MTPRHTDFRGMNDWFSARAAVRARANCRTVLSEYNRVTRIVVQKYAAPNRSR